MSTLSYFSNLLTFADQYRRFATDNNFAEFTSSVSKYGWEQYFKIIVHNMLRTMFDPILYSLIAENENILYDETMNFDQRLQLFIGKFVVQFHQFVTFMLQLNQFNIVVNQDDIVRAVVPEITTHVTEYLSTTSSTTSSARVTGLGVYDAMFQLATNEFFTSSSSIFAPLFGSSVDTTGDVYDNISQVLGSLNTTANMTFETNTTDATNVTKRRRDDNDGDNNDETFDSKRRK
jgi:hypothetical protein